MSDALGRAGVDPYSEPDHVEVFDTAAPGGGFALRAMSAEEEQRYGDEPVHTRCDPDSGEVLSWIEPADLDWPRWRAAQARRDLDDVLHRLEQHAQRMTREDAGDALARHHSGPTAGAGRLVGGAQALEDAAAAARVAAGDHGWDTTTLLTEARDRARATSRGR